MTAYKKQPRETKFPWFYLIYFIFLAAAITALVAVLRIENNLLLEYESVQPRHTAEAAFNKYFAPLDLPGLLADAEYDADGLSEEELTEYLTEQIGDSELTFASGSSSDADTMRYIVRSGSKQVAAIVLDKSQNTTEHGFTAYDFTKIELFIVVGEAPPPPPPEKPKITVIVEAPAGYAVTVDGEDITDGYLTSTLQKTDVLMYYPSTEDGAEYVTDFNVYTLPELEELPGDVTVISDEGAAAEIVFDEKTNTYSAGIVYSEALKEQYAEFVTQALEGFASFTHNIPGTSLENLKPYFDRSAQIYRDLREVERNLWMELASDSDAFEDVEIGEFYMLPDGVISCHISFVEILYRRGKERYEEMDMYVFLRPVDGEYKIFEWHKV